MKIIAPIPPTKNRKKNLEKDKPDTFKIALIIFFAKNVY